MNSHHATKTELGFTQNPALFFYIQLNVSPIDSTVHTLKVSLIPVGAGGVQKAATFEKNEATFGKNEALFLKKEATFGKQAATLPQQPLLTHTEPDTPLGRKHLAEQGT
jgi:hypothetical protein